MIVMTANPRDYGLPDDAVLVSIDGVVRDLRDVPTEEGGDWVPPSGEHYKAALRQRPPAPGTGIISITPFEDAWNALWEDADEGSPDVRTLEGPPGMTREQAIEWALGLAAKEIRIFDGENMVPVQRPRAV